MSTGAVTKTEIGPRAAELVDAAALLFFERGYPQTTTREITNACGMTPGAMYNHFVSKEELLWVIVQEAYLEAETRLLEAVERGAGDPVAEMRELVTAFTQMHTTTFKVKAIVARAERRRLSPERAAQIEEIHERVPRIVAGILERGIERGVFEFPAVDGKPADLVVLGRSICGFCIYSGYWFGPQHPIGSDQLAELYAGLVLKMAGASVVITD